MSKKVCRCFALPKHELDQFVLLGQNKRRAVEPSGAQDCADVVLNLGQFKLEQAAA